MKRSSILVVLAVVAVLTPPRPPASDAGDPKPPSDTPPPSAVPAAPAGPAPVLPPPTHSTPAVKPPAPVAPTPPAPTPAPVPPPQPTPAPIATPAPSPIPEPIPGPVPAPVPAPAPLPTPVPAPPPPAPDVPVTPILAPTPGTHLRLESLRHDFGVVRQNADLKAAIVMTNVGTTPVHVTARGECACAQATVSKKTLEPGESGTLDLNVHTYTFVGKILKHVRVTSDDPESADMAIEVAADVSAGVLLEPANFFFNSSLVGTSPSATVKVKYHEVFGRPFQVKDVKATGSGVGDVNFEAKPFFEGRWRGYEVTMRFAHPPPVGMVSGEALIYTDDPDYAALKCLVGGNISGKVFIAQETTSVGIPTEGKEVVLKVGVRGFDDTIDLGDVTARARKGVVSAKAVRDPTDAKQWTIEITLPGTTTPGAVDDVVEVTTAVKGEEHHEIRVGGTVIAKP